jgi:hypothetical protein
MTMRFEGGVPRNPETDAHVAALTGQAREDAERLLKIFRAELPKAQEAIRWNNPMWFVDGVCAVFLMTYPKRVNLGLGDGATLADPQGIIEGTGAGMRHIKLKSATEPSDAVLRRYVKKAAAQAKKIAKESPPAKKAR